MSLFGSEHWMYASGAASFYDHQIDGSLLFAKADSAALTRTPSSTGNRKTWTFSAWVKLSKFGHTSNSLFQPHNGGNESTMRFNSSNKLQIYNDGGGSLNLQTNAVFRDVSAWYHVVFRVDTTQATASNRVRIYVNGEQQSVTGTNPSQNADLEWNLNCFHTIGRAAYTTSNDQYFDGYMAEINHVDGQSLDPTSFGETKSGVWIPKAYAGSYGSNGFYLKFAGNANDSSGNGNNWTANNLSSYDYVPDSPTNNFATLNSALPDSPFNTDQLSQGNLIYNSSQGNNGDGRPTATMGPKEGKWYWEVQVPSQQNSRAIGFTRTDNIGKGNVTLHGSGLSSANSVVGIDLTDDTIDQVNKSGAHTQHASGLTGMADNDIFGISVNLDGGTFQMYRNGSTYGSSYNLSDLSDWQANGMTPTASGNSYQAYRFNFGQDSTFAGNTTAGGNSDANGYGDFKYSVPSGYLALCTANLTVAEGVDPLEDNSPQDHFNTKLYSGNGSTQNITGVGFQPSLTVIKSLNHGHNPEWYQAVEGATKMWMPSYTNSDATRSTGLTSFNADGFSLGNSIYTNQSGLNFVAWNWKANGAGSSNPTGSISSTVSANPDAGISILKWTGTGASGTLGHGLNSAPKFLINKCRYGSTSGFTEYWNVWCTGMSIDNRVLFVSGSEISAQGGWGGTEPSSSVIYLGSKDELNGSGGNFQMVAFAPVEGFSSMGTYVGNGSSDGAFVYTGMRPAWLLVKRLNNTDSWEVFDTERTNYNGIGKYLRFDSSAAEARDDNYPNPDFLSNGFKWRSVGGSVNDSGHTYIYLAFAENPFKYSTAR